MKYCRKRERQTSYSITLAVHQGSPNEAMTIITPSGVSSSLRWWGYDFDWMFGFPVVLAKAPLGHGGSEYGEFN
jgi:hypothetical protein